jgi:hypothetical protein
MTLFQSLFASGFQTGVLALSFMALLFVAVMYLRPGAFVERRFRRTCEGAGLSVSHKSWKGEVIYSIPSITRRQKQPFGYVLTVLMPKGMSVEDLVKCEAQIADGLGASEVRITRPRASVALIEVYLRDAAPPAFSVADMAEHWSPQHRGRR